MRAARIFVHNDFAGRLVEEGAGASYVFAYDSDYVGAPVSLTMPVQPEPYRFDTFPPFFDGLLPEGWQLDALLRRLKLDRSDRMAQLLAVGKDTVGAVTVSAAQEADGGEASL